jgi:MFS family permease
MIKACVPARASLHCALCAQSSWITCNCTALSEAETRRRVQLRCKWDLNSSQESWIASAVFIGMMAGSYTWGSLSDAFGRRLGFLAPACFTAIFGVASAFSPNYGVRTKPARRPQADHIPAAAAPKLLRHSSATGFSVLLHVRASA